MNENIALWILQASITAAGLIFLVYTIVFPVLNRLLETRAEAVITTEENIKKVSTEPTKIDEDDVSKLKELIRLPWWISRGLMATFILYLLSVILCVIFLLENPQSSNNISLLFFLVPSNTPLVLFLLATIVFAITGYHLLNNIKNVLEKQFRESIQKRKETMCKDLF